MYDFIGKKVEAIIKLIEKNKINEALKFFDKHLEPLLDDKDVPNYIQFFLLGISIYLEAYPANAGITVNQLKAEFSEIKKGLFSK